MANDEAIRSLSKKLDEWFDKNVTLLTGMDQLKRGKALFDGIEIVKELDRIKAEGFEAVSSVLARNDYTTEAERIASLVDAFALGARLKHALSNELQDTDGANKAVLQTNAIADALDAIGADRRLALAPLMNHPDGGVRATAGAYLLSRIPDRVLPILRQVEESERGTSAHYTAYWARRGWELDGK